MQQRKRSNLAMTILMTASYKSEIPEASRNGLHIRNEVESGDEQLERGSLYSKAGSNSRLAAY